MGRENARLPAHLLLLDVCRYGQGKGGSWLGVAWKVEGDKNDPQPIDR